MRSGGRFREFREIREFKDFKEFRDMTRVIPVIFSLVLMLGCRGTRSVVEDGLMADSAAVVETVRRELVRERVALRALEGEIRLDSVELEVKPGRMVKGYGAEVRFRESRVEDEREMAAETDSMWRVSVSRAERHLEDERENSAGGMGVGIWVMLALIGIFCVTLRLKRR